MSPAPMPPMAASEGAAPEQEASAPKKSPKDLIVGINSDLMQLADMLGGNQATAEEAKAMGGLVQQYQSIVESLGQAPGAPKPQAPAASGPAPVSPEAGANPNARPM